MGVVSTSGPKRRFVIHIVILRGFSCQAMFSRAKQWFMIMVRDAPRPYTISAGFRSSMSVGNRQYGEEEEKEKGKEEEE